MKQPFINGCLGFQVEVIVPLKPTQHTQQVQITSPPTKRPLGKPGNPVKYYLPLKKKTTNTNPPFTNKYLDLPRGAKWMLKGATKRRLRVQTPPLGGCWYHHFFAVPKTKSNARKRWGFFDFGGLLLQDARECRVGRLSRFRQEWCLGAKHRMSSEEKGTWLLVGYIGDEILPSYMGIIEKLL